MALGDTLKDYYKRLEDKYYGLMDYISDKGIPVYRAIDAIESRNIPSFPVFVLLCLLVLGGLVWAVTALLMPVSMLTLAVQDEGGNPLEGAAITISAEGIESIAGETETGGTFTRPVPIGIELTVLASKIGYDSETKNYTLENADEKRSITLYEAITHLSRSVRLMKPGTSELIDDSISVSFSCSGADYYETFYNSTGMFNLEDIPSDCGILYVAPGGGYAASTDSFNVENARAYEIYLSAPDIDKGTVVGYVNNAEQNPLNGIEVALKTSLGDELQRKTTLSSGSVTFSDVEPGRYYLTTYDPTGVFAEYNTSTYGDIKEVPEGGTSTFYVVLERRNVGTVKILVKDSSSMLAVEDAIVTLSKGGSAIAPKKTGMDGKVEFDVGENVGYDVTVDHAEYLLEKKTAVFPSLDYREVLVTKATVENSQSLTVTVVDEKGKPVEGTRLKLKDSLDGKDIGSEIVTGVDGVGVFQRLQEGSYYVYAYKPGFGEKSSNVIAVTAREENELRITLPIGSGGLLVSVLDEKKQALGGATVKIIDYYTGVRLDEQLTDTSGAKAFEVRADKTVYLEVSAPGTLPYRTIPIKMVKDITQEAEVTLVKSIAKLEVGLEDITGSGSINGAVTEGQAYTAKLQLKVPENSTFDEVGIHFRTGAEEEGKTTTMESDYIYITDVEAAATTVLRGAAYTPGTGFAIDSEHFTSGEAKWVNIIFESPSEGVYEAVVKFRISEVAPKGELLDLHYRGWGKTGAYVRFPADTVLASAEQTGTRQALYAQTKLQKLQVGATGFCMDNFCTVLTIEDLSEKLESVIIDSFPASISANYRLSFDIVNESPAAYPNAELQITNEAGALQFIDYAVTDVGGTPRSGSAEGAGIAVPLGNMGKDDGIKGNVQFRTIKEGASDLVIAIVSEKQKIIEKRVRIETSAAAEMDVEILPKMLVPYIKNVVMVNVDSPGTSPVPEATVTLLLDGEVIAQGETDALGVYSYELSAPSPGSVLSVQVEKEGFRSIAMALPISENILVSVPSAINELLVIGTNPSIDVPLTIKNTTAIPLTVVEARDDGDFPTYVTTKWDNDYAGDALSVGGDKNMYVTFSLNSKGANLNSPKTLEGSLTFVLTNPEFGTTWAAEIPVTIRIGFGDSVDDGECFHLQPLAWEVYTGTETKELDMVLKNSCAVDGEEIPLNRIEVKLLATAESGLGLFEVSSNIENSATIELTENYRVLVDGIAAGEEKAVKVKFKPADIDTGSASPTIVFLATHMTAAGSEELKRELKVSLNINNFVECIEFIRAENMKISSCPYSMGLSNLSSYGTNYSSYLGTQNYWGTTDYSWIQPAGTTTSTTDYSSLYGASSSYPYTATGYPYLSYQSSLYNTNYNAAWQCGERKFTLRNNCESPVEIELAAADGLVVEESTFTIAPEEETEVSVQPAYLAGLFNLDVAARTAGSKEKAKKLRTLQVVVENLLATPYDECFTLEPNRVVDMSDIIQKPKEIKLINTCYNQGVRMLNEGGLSFGSGHEQIVEGVKFLESNFETDAAGGVIQVNRYEISPNYTYRYEEEQTAEFPKNEGAIETLVGLRRFATANYYYVNHYVNALVKYTSPQGSGASKAFSMILRDWWHLGAGASELMASRGHADADPADCFDASSVNICGNIGTIPTGLLATPYEFETSDAFEFTTDTKPTAVVCGAADKITRVDVSLLNGVLPEGMSISAETFDNGHNIRFTLNAVEWYEFYRHLEGKSIKGKVKVTVTRANGKRATITTDAEICIDAKDKVNPAINAVSPTTEGWQDTELVLSITDKLPSSGLNKDTIKVKLGNENYTIGSSELKYEETGFNSAEVTVKPRKNFDPNSKVSVNVEIKDKAGNKGERNWSYDVKPGVEENAVSGSTTATTLAQDTVAIQTDQTGAQDGRNAANKKVTAAQTGTTGEVKGCTLLDGTTKIGETGTGVYNKYGFDKIMYNWTDKVNKDFCDAPDGYFCDASQLTLALTQKGAILEDFLRALESNYCKGDYDCLDSKQDTGKLYLDALETVTVNNSCLSGDDRSRTYFVADKTGGIVEAMTLEEFFNKTENASAKKILDNAHKLTVTQENSNTIVGYVLDAIGSSNLNPNYKDFVVLVNKAIGSGFETKFKLQKGTGSYYLMSFCDFQALNEGIKNNPKCADATESETGCTVNGFTGAISNADMETLYNNMTIAIGLNDDGSDAVKARAIAEGKLKDGLPLKFEGKAATYASFNDFYNDIVEPEVYLMADGYGKSLVRDFMTVYFDKGTIKDVLVKTWTAAKETSNTRDLINRMKLLFEGGEWAYNIGGKVDDAIITEPGQYKVKLNYNWSKINFGVSGSPSIAKEYPGKNRVYYQDTKPTIKLLLEQTNPKATIETSKIRLKVNNTDYTVDGKTLKYTTVNVQRGLLEFTPSSAFTDKSKVTVQYRYVGDTAATRDWEFTVDTTATDAARKAMDKWSNSRFDGIYNNWTSTAEEGAYVSGLDAEYLRVRVDMAKDKDLGAIGSGYPENVFFWMPVDGELIRNAGTTITDYGTSTQKSNEPVYVSTTGAGGVLTSKYDYHIGNLAGNQTFQKFNLYEEGNNRPQAIMFIELKPQGQLGQIKFTPNYAVPLTLQNNSDKGVSYFFTTNSEINKAKSNVESAQKLSWVSGSTAKKSSSKTPQACCNGLDIGGSQDCVDTQGTVKTIAYVPMDGKYFLNLWCPVEKATVSATTPFDKTLSEKGSFEIKPAGDEANGTKYYNLEKLMQLVNADKVCVETDSAERQLTLYWNEKELLK